MSNAAFNNILITGGCGFVGVNLIASLKEKGARNIRVLDDESLGKREWIEEFGVDFIKGDIRDKKAVTSALKDMDCVVHLAADTRVIDSIENPAHNWDVNVRGSFTVLEAMRKRGVTRIVNASTGGAIAGDATLPVHETTPARPASPYGAAKLAVEGYCSAYAASYGFNAASLRFSNVYGPRSYHKGSAVALFFRQILNGETLVVYGDGEQTRDFVFVEDLAGGILKCLSQGATGVFQLGSGKGTTVNTLIDAIRKTVGPDHPFDVQYADFREGEVKNTWCEISKARKELGFDPATPLSEGLARTWAWFKDR